MDNTGRAMRLCFLLVCLLLHKISALDVEVSARSAILMNADTGAILFEKDAHLPAYPASTTKIGTALFVLDGKKGDLQQVCFASEMALQMKTASLGRPHWLEVDGTMMGLKKGENLPLDALLHGMMMVSGNDAANVIAESLSGSVPMFMSELNQYLSEIGCQKTNYVNPHGLHHPEHVTTAYDLAWMMKKGLTIPKFRDLISKVSYLRPKSNKSPKAELVTFNQLLKPGKYYYEKAIGGKTGYHSQSMATLTTAAHFEGRTLIAVVLGCTKTSRYTDVKNLFEAAFREKPVDRLLMNEDQTFSRQIEDAESSLLAALESPLKITYFPAEEPHVRAFIHWHPLQLPIHLGQVVAEVQVVEEGGRLVATAPLIAKTELKGTWAFRIKQWFGI